MLARLADLVLIPLEADYILIIPIYIYAANCGIRYRCYGTYHSASYVLYLISDAEIRLWL